MRLKKVVLSTACLAVGALTLASCGEEKTTQEEPEVKDCVLNVCNQTGSKDAYTVTATTDKEKVVEVLEKMLSVTPQDPVAILSQGFQVNAKANFKVTGTDDGKKCDATAKAEASLKFKLDATGIQGEAEASGSCEMNNGTETGKLSASASAFVKSGVGYAAVKVEQTGSVFDFENVDHKVSVPMSSLTGEFDFSQIAVIASTYKQQLLQLTDEDLEEVGLTQADMVTYCNTGYLKISKEMHEVIASAVEQSNLVISNADSEALVFSAGYMGITLSVTLNPSNLLVTKIAGDTGNNFVKALEAITGESFDELDTCTGSFEVLVSYGCTIDTSNKSTDGYVSLIGNSGSSAPSYTASL